MISVILQRGESVFSEDEASPIGLGNVEEDRYQPVENAEGKNHMALGSRAPKGRESPRSPTEADSQVDWDSTPIPHSETAAVQSAQSPSKRKRRLLCRRSSASEHATH